MAVQGDKVSVCSAGRYILVAHLDEKSSSKRTAVNIYDLRNKIICSTSKKYYLPIGEKIMVCLSDNDTTYIISSPSRTLIRFKEKDTRRKLDVLLNNSDPPLYSLAILLAAEEQLEPSEMMKLYKVTTPY